MYLYKHYMGEKIVYIGMTINLAQRTMFHESKAMWFKNVTYIEFEKFDDIKKLRAAEMQAIKKYEPINNSTGNPTKLSWVKRYMGLDVHEFKGYKVILKDKNNNFVYGATFFDKALAAEASDKLRLEYFDDNNFYNKQMGFY